MNKLRHAATKKLILIIICTYGIVYSTLKRFNYEPIHVQSIKFGYKCTRIMYKFWSILRQHRVTEDMGFEKEER